MRLLCLQFVCSCFDCIRIYLVKQENYSIYKQNKLVRLHCSSFGDIIDTSLQPFTVFIKKTLADIIILWLWKLVITILIHNKDDIEFVTEFPCLLGYNMGSFKTRFLRLSPLWTCFRFFFYWFFTLNFFFEKC